MTSAVTSGYELDSVPEFDDKVEQFAQSMQRWDEIALSYDLRLSRDPHTGDRIDNTPLWAFRLRANGRPITLYYTINENTQTVTLLDIHVIHI